MKFRLVYDGPVLATRSVPQSGEKPSRSQHKFDLRRAFHHQLKNIWKNDPFLSQCSTFGTEFGSGSAKNDKEPLHDALARNHEMFGWRFVPLVVESFSLSCSLRILFLRRQVPGGILQQGDIDNRVKTIFDALRLPQNKTEMFGNEAPGEGENPFYVLLRDDALITHAEVEADTLWEDPPDEKGGQSHARVVIDVVIKPTFVTMLNLSFAGG